MSQIANRNSGRPGRNYRLLICLVLGFCCGLAAAQTRQSAHRARPSDNRIVTTALSRVVVVEANGTTPAIDARNLELAGVLHRQSEAVRSLLVAAQPVVGNTAASHSGPLLNGGTQMLNPQPYPPKGSAPQIGAGQTMSARGTLMNSTAADETHGGPTRQQPPSSERPQMIGTRAPMPTQMCRAGISTVDGGTSGIWFSPVAGQDGTFVIQGCGFGTTPGQVYLSGVKYAPKSPANTTQVRLWSAQHPDRVSFQISPNNWSDRQIVAQIDPNAGGLYDTSNVALVVTTGSGQTYQATGMNFVAAREDQVLTGLPKNARCTQQSAGPACIPTGVNLVSARSSNGIVAPDVESPSLSLLRPGATIAVARETASGQFPIPQTPGISFRGGLDTYQFSFAPGFQLDPQHGVTLRHSSADPSYCQAVNGVYSNSGNWSVKYTSTSSFQIYWEEEGCWPKTAMSGGTSLDVLNYASVSAYELDITVLGPRGINPWPNSGMGGISTLPMKPSQLLLKQ